MIPPGAEILGSHAPGGDRAAFSLVEQPARVALAHDWLVGLRGGEAVLEEIAAVVRSRHTLSCVYTMFSDGRPLAPHIDAAPRSVARLGRLPGASTRLRRWLLPLYPFAVGELARRLAADHARQPIDVLFSTSSAAIKGLRPPPGVPHICYCHAPARYLWSQTDAYSRGSGGGARALGLNLFAPRLRGWDRRTAANVSTFLANSSHTARQIREFYGRDALVVHPPVRTDFFTPDAGEPRDGSWLYVGALEPYKRVDLAILAANGARHQLVVVGRGTQAESLRAIAGPTVRFLGHVSDDELRRLYRRAGVLLFPQTEDFGITAVEAQSCGTPVAAFRAGGALDSVVEGVTGAFFDAPEPGALAAAARSALDLPHLGGAARANAERFSRGVFTEAIAAVLEKTLQNRRDQDTSLPRASPG